MKCYSTAHQKDIGKRIEVCFITTINESIENQKQATYPQLFRQRPSWKFYLLTN